MRGLIFICLAFLVFLTGSGDILYWQVNENTTVDGGDIQEFLEPYPSDSSDDYLFFPAARVRMVSSDGSSSSILPILIPEYDGNPSEWVAGDIGVEPGNWGSGYWETGLVQSETGFNTINRIQDIIHGDVLDVPPEVLESMFIMELGYNEWNESADDYVWKTLAESKPELYKDLVSRYMFAPGNIAPGPDHIWTPNFRTTVPEPSSILLCMIGARLLGLRRRA